MMDQRRSRMETEIGQGWSGDWMEVDWEQHEDHWWGWDRDGTRVRIELE